MIRLDDPHRAIRAIELEVLRRLDGILQGDYQGFLPGHGSEPGEARPYRAGDDVRRIDWNVTARTTEPHIRDAVADRELETTLVVDQSGSMSFGTVRGEKRDLAAAAAGAVGLLAQRGGNRVGAVLLAGRDRIRVPARSGRRHLHGLMLRILDAPRSLPPVDLAAGLREADRVARRRGLVAVLSDFLDESAWQRPLSVLAERHDVLCIEVLDPRELDLPAMGRVTLQDPETGRRRWVDTTSVGLRDRFREAARSQRTDLRRRIRRAGAQHLVLTTDRDWVADLVRHVAHRRRGRSTGRRP